jgi:hypothetical protein
VLPTRPSSGGATAIKEGMCRLYKRDFSTVAGDLLANLQVEYMRKLAINSRYFDN